MKRYGIIFRPLLVILLIAGIFWNVGSVIYQQRDKYLARDYWENFENLEQKYLDSQYINKKAKEWLRDEVVFSYSGGALIRGTNPVLVIPDAPPLGKYLIGLSVLFFNNDSIVTAFFGILALPLFYYLSLIILKNKLLSLIPVFLYSSETMYKNQFIYAPLMDLFQLVFILSFFIFLIKGFSNKRKSLIYFIIANVFLGFFISTKFFVSGLTIAAAAFIWFVLHKNFLQLTKYLFTFPVAVLVLLASYSRVFAFGYDLDRFLGIQKWVYLYHQSNLILPFSIWPLLMVNRWYVWFGDKPFISDSQWSIAWPIVTIISILTILLYVFKYIKRQAEIEILMIWSVCYLVFFSAGQIFSRYFIILMPILYIISLWGLKSLYLKFSLNKPSVNVRINKRVKK